MAGDPAILHLPPSPAFDGGRGAHGAEITIKRFQRDSERTMNSFRATLIACVAFGLMAAGPRALAVQMINLLPMGDSITWQGMYIAPLAAALADAGYSPTLIANEGYSGITIDGLRSGIADHMNHPGVSASNTYILLMVGVNDLYTGTDVPDAPTRLRGLISDITTIAPLAHVIVAQISPDTLAWMDPLVRRYNEDIVPVIHSFGPQVTMVDMYTPFQPNPQLYLTDTVHPNQAGGDLMADVWYHGIISTPEPNSLTLLGTSAVGWATFVWRRRRRCVRSVFWAGRCRRAHASN
jgi:lysophospholipase L1-like esterase